MTLEPLSTDGVVKQTSNSLLEVAMPTDSPPDIRKIGSGQQLAQARASAGLSVEALAARLRVSTAQVLALDAERWDQLPDKAFVRAVLRAYAKQIDVDVTPLIDHVGGYGEPTVLEATNSVESVARGTTAGNGFQQNTVRWRESMLKHRWSVVGVGCVLLLGFVVMLFGGLGEPPTAARVQSVPIPGVNTPAMLDNGQGRPAINSGGALSGSLNVQRVPVAEQTPSVGPSGSIIRQPADPVTIRGAEAVEPRSLSMAADAGAKPSVEPGDDRVRVAGAVTVFPVQMPDSEPVHVHFKKRVWIDISHKDGVKLLSGTQDANQSFKLDGTPPMRVQIGNPSGVAIEFRGQLVDLKSKTNDKGVASFTLN